MKTTLAMICALGLCVSAPVFAETDMAKMGMMADASMKMMDTNADGMLSSDEMTAVATMEKFDMGMTPDPAKTSMMVSKKMAMMDNDKDGMVSMAEEDASSKMRFMSSDANKDNMVSRQEMMDGMSAHMKMMK